MSLHIPLHDGTKCHVVLQIKNVWTNSGTQKRAVVVDGQGAPKGTLAECGYGITKREVGTYVKTVGMLTKSGREVYRCYCYYKAPYRVISEKEALALIKRHEVGFFYTAIDMKPVVSFDDMEKIIKGFYKLELSPKEPYKKDKAFELSLDQLKGKIAELATIYQELYASVTDSPNQGMFLVQHYMEKSGPIIGLLEELLWKYQQDIEKAKH